METERLFAIPPLRFLSVQTVRLRIELRAQVIDLSDQLVDTLGDVLSALIRLQELLVEQARAVRLLVHLASQRGVLALQAAVTLHQRRDDPFQAIEIVRPVVGIGNDETPNP
jgi:hypothetical protein